jgi:hypothetical protein
LHHSGARSPIDLDKKRLATASPQRRGHAWSCTMSDIDTHTCVDPFDYLYSGLA